MNNYFLTDKGYKHVEDIINKEVNLYTNNGFVNTFIKVYVDNLYTIEFFNNKTITVPENHKVYNEDLELIYIKDLKKSNKIYRFDINIIDINDTKNDYSYTNGYYTAWLYDFMKKNKTLEKRNNMVILSYNIDNFNFKNRFKIIGKVIKKNDKNVAIIKYNSLEVPINSSLENKIEWLAGVLDSIGYVYHKKFETRYLKIKITNQDYANKIILLCNTIGLLPNLEEIKSTRKQKLSSGELKIDKLVYYIITIKSDDINKLYLEYNMRTSIIGYDYKEFNIDPDTNDMLYIKDIKCIGSHKTIFMKKNINYIMDSVSIVSLDTDDINSFNYKII